MKSGDIVWFDMYYHKPQEYKGYHPSEYAVLGIVIKKYKEKRKDGQLPLQRAIDILVGETIYCVPERSLILAGKTVK